MLTNTVLFSDGWVAPLVRCGTCSSAVLRLMKLTTQLHHISHDVIAHVTQLVRYGC